MSALSFAEPATQWNWTWRVCWCTSPMTTSTLSSSLTCSNLSVHLKQEVMPYWRCLRELARLFPCYLWLWLTCTTTPVKSPSWCIAPGAASFSQRMWPNKPVPRTIPEMEKVMEELRKLTTYWAAQGEPLPLVIPDSFSWTSESMSYNASGGFDAQQQKEPLPPSGSQGGEGRQGEGKILLHILHFSSISNNYSQNTSNTWLVKCINNTFKIVDSRCHQLTAPHVREKHQNDSQVNIIKPVVATIVTITFLRAVLKRRC